MGMTDTVRQGIARLAGGYGGPSALAAKAGVAQPVVSKFLSGKAIPRFDTMVRILEVLGARLLFPDEHGNGPDGASASGAYVPGGNSISVPLASEEMVARPGPLEADSVRRWVPVLKRQAATRGRANLLAWEMEAGHAAMFPTLAPLDVVVVDRDDASPEPGGSLFLVRTPEPEAMVTVRRVSVCHRQGQTLLTFACDNPDRRAHPVAVYSVESDYQGDIRRALAGRVICSWADMTKK